MRISASLPLPGPFRLGLGSIGGSRRRSNSDSFVVTLFELMFWSCVLAAALFVGAIIAAGYLTYWGFLLSRFLWRKYQARQMMKP